MKGVRKLLGRGHYVVEQTDFTQVEPSGQMKSKKLILKVLGSQFQNLDLGAHLEANGRIVYLRDSQSCPGENRCYVFTCFSHSDACQTSDSPGGARYRTEVPGLGKAHENGSAQKGNLARFATLQTKSILARKWVRG